MLAKVLKSFRYSRDGVQSEQLAVGQELEIKDALVPGLLADRLIEPSAASETAEVKPEEPGGFTKKVGKFGRFDVLDADGNKMNDKLLAEADADNLIAELSRAPE